MNMEEQITNKFLIQKLNNLKNNFNEQTQKLFFKELKKAKLLTPLANDSSSKMLDENNILHKDQELKILCIVDTEGTQYIPAFTDWKELKKWKSNIQKTIMLTINDYERILRTNKIIKGIALNPYGDNIILDINLINQTKGNLTKLKQGESVMIGEPQEFSIKMMAELKKQMPHMPIKSAYLLWMVRNTEDSNYLLIVEIEKNVKHVCTELADIIKDFLDETESLNILPLSDDFSKSAIEDQVPFYKKS